jgi:hypothetical protein
MGAATAQTRVGDIEFVSIFEDVQVLSLRNIVKVSASIAPLRAAKILEFCFVHDSNVQRIWAASPWGVFAVLRGMPIGVTAWGFILNSLVYAIKMNCEFMWGREKVEPVVES